MGYNVANLARCDISSENIRGEVWYFSHLAPPTQIAFLVFSPFPSQVQVLRLLLSSPPLFKKINKKEECYPPPHCNPSDVNSNLSPKSYLHPYS